MRPLGPIAEQPTCVITTQAPAGICFSESDRPPSISCASTLSLCRACTASLSQRSWPATPPHPAPNCTSRILWTVTRCRTSPRAVAGEEDHGAGRASLQVATCPSCWQPTHSRVRASRQAGWCEQTREFCDRPQTQRLSDQGAEGLQLGHEGAGILEHVAHILPARGCQSHAKLCRSRGPLCALPQLPQGSSGLGGSPKREDVHLFTAAWQLWAGSSTSAGISLAPDRGCHAKLPRFGPMMKPLVQSPTVLPCP
jgi:hypothetical protein